MDDNRESPLSEDQVSSIIDVLKVTLGAKNWLSWLHHYHDVVRGVIDDGLPEAIDDLRDQAEQSGWNRDDFEAARQGLEGSYGIGFPRILTFSTITLVYTVLEAQLRIAASFLGKKHGLPIKLSDLNGSLLDRANLFFGKILGVPVSDDPAWMDLRDLVFLRNWIVHHAGIIGENPKARDRVRQIDRRISGSVGIEDVLGPEFAELSIDSDACAHFISKVHGFFNRLFHQTGIVQMSPEILRGN